jgi:hypothetical protein
MICPIFVSGCLRFLCREAAFFVDFAPGYDLGHSGDGQIGLYW